MQNKPKVLMLGWEFPPLINGGLGVATSGLSKELSKLVDLSLILPKSDINYVLKNVETIGLNNFDIENFKLRSSDHDYTFLSNIDFVQANLLPYQEKEIDLFQKKYAATDQFSLKDKLRADIDVFNTNDLYDGAIGERVYNFAKLASLIALQKDFDIIHAHDWMTFVAAMEIKAQSGKKLVLHIHSLEIDRNGPDSKGWIYQLEKSAMDYADAIIPVSHYTGEMIRNFYSIPASKIYPVHNGIDQVQSFRSDSSLPEKIVLFLGRITGQKGPEYFFETASKVLEFIPNVRFVMAGSGNMLKGLIEMGAFKHLGNKIHFTGFLTQEKVRHLYSIADVYVMPSVSEPFGLSALEAAQFGVPVVISKQSGVAEVMPSTLKADYWDVEKMASNIISILKYKGLRDQLVKDAYHDLSKISWTKSAADVYNIYTHNLLATN
ncbi:MAG: glycosyltransferase family 4 protein [Bacteroidota bacterium]|nr:glycosyltransferase family 4 protein [Bacteroidota bacterium]